MNVSITVKCVWKDAVNTETFIAYISVHALIAAGCGSYPILCISACILPLGKLYEGLIWYKIHLFFVAFCFNSFCINCFKMF